MGYYHEKEDLIVSDDRQSWGGDPAKAADKGGGNGETWE